MKIKFNWGTGITIAIIVMVLFISSLVFVATRQSFHLVEEDYYERGVNYQEQIEKRKNTDKLKQQVEVKLAAGFIELSFPSEFANDSVHGTFHLYSPVDKNYDYKSGIKTDANLLQKIDTKELIKGRYILKIDWKTRSKSFYHEQNINIR